MKVESILEHLDMLFSKQDMEAVEPYLRNQLERAYECQAYDICITILNELIGFFRDTSQYPKSIDCCTQVLSLMKQLGYEGTLPYATTLLNVANALRAAGLHEESLAFYERVFPIYKEHLQPHDERVASLYNNVSLLYQEMGSFEEACRCLEQALEIVSYGEDLIKVAITHSNLAASLLQLGKVDEAMEHLLRAFEIFEKFHNEDFHYGAAVAAMAQAYTMKGRLKEARTCYYEALSEQLKYCGKSEAFYRILESLHMVERALHMPETKEPEDTFCWDNSMDKESKPEANSEQVVTEDVIIDEKNSSKLHPGGLELSMDFYESKAKESLFEAFPELIDRFAVGLVGEGSECFGFDDVLSTDHDFGPGFCIWLTKEDYEKYGQALCQWYETLPHNYRGFVRKPGREVKTVVQSGHSLTGSEDRAGIWSMDDFFAYFTGYTFATMVPDENALLQISEESLAAMFNGRLFYDPKGMFRCRRQAFYDLFTEKIWQIKISNSLILLGKYGQYNYPRAMKRGDYVTAQMILYKYIEELLKLVHYVNHVFPPYYKWLKKSASKQKKLAVFASLANALTDFADGRTAWQSDASGTSDKVVGTIEIIAKLIVEELRTEGLLDGLVIPKEELFLEVYGRMLLENTLANNIPERRLSPLTDSEVLENNSKEELVEYMVSLEWQAFDEVQNQGGRADCQDDWGTFSIMRKSQYLAWTKELIISFIQDFRNANKRGWNLITEKYARMMKTTDPASYVKIADQLPFMTEQQENIIEQIVKIQVAWMEEFALEYPEMAFNSRSIRTSEDSLFNTSYETYLRGELSTYGPQTLKLYGAFIVELTRTGQNLAQLIMTNTALLYGYESLKEAERKIAGENK